MRSGFSYILLLLIVSIVIVIGFVMGRGVLETKVSNYLLDETSSGSSDVRWNYDSDKDQWVSSEQPPNCNDSLQYDSPVDLSYVSGILYPGQIRGTDYKPHGSFRFDDLDTNAVEVRAISEGYVMKISKYQDEWGEQKLLFYINPCGIMVMHDHMVDVSPRLQELYDEIPLGVNGDSRTTDVSDLSIVLGQGEVLATTVGYEDFPSGHNGRNIFVDFGLYDLREKNGVDYPNEFRDRNPNIDEYGQYALCWLDYLDSEDSEYVYALPVGGVEGSVSDYCVVR